MYKEIIDLILLSMNNEIEDIETNLSLVEIDSIIWQFCASNYAEICDANPNCEKCLLRKRCNYNAK